MTTTAEAVREVLAGGKAQTAVPCEPAQREWERRAALLLEALEQGAVPPYGRRSFVAGWMVGIYRHGYWDAKLAEVAPDNPGPPPLAP